MGGLAKIGEGFARKRAADLSAKQLRKRAKARRAEAGAEAREEIRQGDLIESRNMAVAAASGASLADPTFIRLMADVDADSEYRALTRLYEGETEARSDEIEAKVRKREGRAVLVSSILSGVESMSEKYG